MIVLFARALENSTLAEKWMYGMAPEKRLKIEKMRRKNDAMTAITAHRLLCLSLKCSYNIEPLPEDWGAGEYGKPYLKSTDEVHFSISHSGNMAMCAVDDQPVGADIEIIRPFQAGLEKRIMSEAENSVFAQDPHKIQLFYKIWTLKESYLKYTGQGLGALGEITVIPKVNGIESNAIGCRFSLIDCAPGYQAAVCGKTADIFVDSIGENALNSF